MKISINHAAAQGLRTYMEDYAYINTFKEGTLLAVFDGHGGDTAAQTCFSSLQNFFTMFGNMEALPTPIDKLRGLFAGLVKSTENLNCGTTATIVFIPSTLDRAYVGILGDSPVIIKTPTGDYWRGPEHNVRSNTSEAARIKVAGGMGFNGYAYPPVSGFSANGLQLSRAMGDAEFSSILSREPEIFEVPLGPNSFILVGSDGLFDPHHTSDSSAATMVDLVEKGATAGNLVSAALKVPTHDNVTAILARLEN